jgi:GDP-L-fucose synthase|tara:strand:+ start:238 stop:1173 length:936 start_codon:yes stop_codon:yes gene_type:complete
VVKNIFNSLKGKKIAITGSNGFVSHHLINYLKTNNLDNKYLKLINSKNTDYNSLEELCKRLKNIDYVIHLSSATGGIKYTKENTSDQLYITMIKDLNVFQACKKMNIKKLITLGNLHAYPKDLKNSIKESDLHKGLPTTPHLGIGWSKRNLAIMSDIFSRQSKTKFIIIYSANSYGPNDSLDVNYGHIIPTFIIKCLQNKDIDLFGGKDAVREFIYIKDLIEIILLSLIKVNKSCYFNVGSGEKISIGNLISLIAKLTNFKKKITFKNTVKDNSKRYCDKKLSKKILNYKIKYNLKEGILETIEWYKKNTI